MTAVVPEQLFAEATIYLTAGAKFRERTGVNPKEKANEIAACAIVNRWFARHWYTWRIALSSAPRGKDGEVLDMEPPNWVEVKSANVELSTIASGKKTRASFLFERDFASDMDPCAMDRHGCVVMALFSEGELCTIYIAFGKQSLKTLSDMLHVDAARKTYKKENGDKPRIFVDHVPDLNVATFAARGDLPTDLESAVASMVSAKREDAIIRIDKAEIQSLAKSMELADS